jgi:RNA recognition motif-containing protein
MSEQHLQSKRWADHGEDSEDEVVLEAVAPEVPASTGKIALGGQSRGLSGPRGGRDPHATRLVVGNLDPEVSESQVSRFIGSSDISVRLNRQRGLAFIDVHSRASAALVDRILSLDGTRLGRRIVSVRLDAAPRRPVTAAAPERWAFVETDKTSEKSSAKVIPAEAPIEAEERVPLQLEAPRVVEATDSKHLDRLVRKREAKQQSMNAKISESKTKQSTNRFAALTMTSDEDE